MTARQIAKRVQDEADARFGDTVERLLLILRQRHTHQCWRKECYCDYCTFINGKYVDEKLRLHALKKRIRHYDNLWALTEDEVIAMLSVENNAVFQKWHIKALKKHKKDLQKEIL